MSYQLPPIEVVANAPIPPSTSPASEPRGLQRWVIFLGVLVPALVVGMGFVWLREPIYQSRATLLTVAPIVIDQDMIGGSEAKVVIQDDRSTTSEHVTIQQERLLGPSLLENVRARVRSSGAWSTPPDLSISQLMTMLAVTPFPDTNVVELRAQGPDAKLLPIVIDAWIDAYQDLRAQETRTVEDKTVEALREEFAQLEKKVEEKRKSLDSFRRTHDILSRKDADNQALARLRGLNESLNKASEEEVKAKARIDAVRQAIARGESVAPSGEKLSLSYLEQRAQDLREKLADLKRRYTPEYIVLQPQLKVIPEQLRQVEKEIAEKKAQGQKEELAEAEQAYRSAKQSVQDIRAQVEEHKREVAEFTTRFAEHEAMEKELADLEELYRKTHEHLLHLEVAPKDRLPQLSVVNRASPPGAPIWPNYRRDSLIALSISLGLSLFAVWLYEFLTRRPAPEMQPSLTIPNINVFSVPENLALKHTTEQARLAEQKTLALERLPPRELSDPELRALLATAPVKPRQVIALLLSGLSLQEAAALKEDAIDLANLQMLVQGTSIRTLPISPVLQGLFAGHRPLPAWSTDPEDDLLDELEAMIACAAVDAGLRNPEEIGAEVLRHTYMVYLVRQGVRLTELERIVGPLPAKTLAWYGRFSPAGPGLGLEAIQVIHPVLTNPEESQAET